MFLHFPNFEHFLIPVPTVCAVLIVAVNQVQSSSNQYKWRELHCTREMLRNLSAVRNVHSTCFKWSDWADPLETSYFIYLNLNKPSSFIFQFIIITNTLSVHVLTAAKLIRLVSTVVIIITGVLQRDALSVTAFILILCTRSMSGTLA